MAHNRYKVETIDSFAKMLLDLLRSDRDVTMAAGGFTGEGKSTFMILLQKAYCKLAGVPWIFQDNLTWSRDELLKWIDGDKDGKGRKPEYSAVLPDELISMFYNRNWYEDAQKGAVELFNKCRDRHLFVGGNIPNFWELDTGMQTRIRFFAYIPLGRGKVWVFEQEDNPFTSDKWNRSENLKIFRKHKNPYRCPNFLCEIMFGDLSPKDKEDYLAIRNSKRKGTEGQNKQLREERYGRIKAQRDKAVRALFAAQPDLTNKEVANVVFDDEITSEGVRLIRYGT